MFVCTCKICNKDFEAKQKTASVCPECIYRPCLICGNPFEHVWPYDQKCCSADCRKKLINDPEHKRKAVAKRDETVKIRYGVSNVNDLASVKAKIQNYHSDKEAYRSNKKIEAKQASASKMFTLTCILCGKQFESHTYKQICPDKHMQKCKVCGKEYEIHSSCQQVVRQTCSNECRKKLLNLTIQCNTRICEYCGKEFNISGSLSKFCSGPHYANCQVCGKQFEVDLTKQSVSDLPKTCSANCQNIQRKRTSLQRYGYESPAQRPEAVEASRLKSLATTDQRMKTCLAKYGKPFYSQTEEARNHLSTIIASSEVKERARATMQSRYGVDHIMQNPDFARQHSNSQFHQLACDGTRVDSRWEALVYDFLVRNNIEFEYNTTSFSFEYNGSQHVTHIDFKIGDLLLEVKGSHLLEGAFDNRPNVVPISRKLEIYREHHVIVVTDRTCASMFGKPNSSESNGLKYLNKCPNPLIGIDISLFDHPEFPFAKDRPPCFYQVKVDNSKSSFDAFYDEEIRWKMILNRINYTGGFIDAKQVLTAMNVTRTCKQPSWFSKTLAKDIIQKYCTSNTVVDCFAGWGMRNDAAVELNRNYVGVDFNQELVSWHKNRGRNIDWADAKEFKYEEECSVFICPPYSDPKTGRCFEDYNFEGFDASAKSLSQCDWLKIVMQNVPHAKEYVMVCKIVDDCFKPYIVDIITNTSHFGANNEYVLVIKNQ